MSKIREQRIEILKELAKQDGGLITTSQIEKAGISRVLIPTFIDEGVLVKEFQSDELVLEGSDSFIAIVDNAEKATAVLTGLNIHYSTNGNCIFLFESEEKSSFAISKLFEAKIQVREFKRNGNALEKILLDKGGDKQ